MKRQSIPFTMYPEANLVLVEACGVITFLEIYQHVQEVLRHPQFKMGMNAYYDFIEVDRLIGDLEIIERIADDLSDSNVVSLPAKTAIVIKRHNENVKDMIKRYMEMTRSSLMKFSIFDDNQQHQARAFLSIDSLPRQ